MSNKYIAVNGDNVGSKIEEAIMSDDHENLQSVSGQFKQSHDMINQWVESIGGQVITSSGNEDIYIIPESYVDDLDDIREKYQKMSDHTLTIGVGSSMMEASKALVFGKLNEKNQMVEYTPEIDQYLSEHSSENDGYEDKDSQDEEGEEEIVGVEEEGEEEGQEIPEKEEEPLGDGIGIGSEKIRDEEREEELGEPEKDIVEDPEDESPASSEEITDDSLEDPEDTQDEPADVDIEGVSPSHEENMPPEEEALHDQNENEEDESDSDLIEADEERQFQPNANGESEDGMEFLSDGDVASGQLDAEGEENSHEKLSNMIYDDMEEEGEEGEEGATPENEEQIPEDNGEDLKSEITEALMGFKQNKEMLEAAKEQMPELYQSVLSMIGAMIGMAKQLGYAPQQEVDQQMATNDLSENFPSADEEGLGESQGEQIPGKKF